MSTSGIALAVFVLACIFGLAFYLDITRGQKR